MTKIVVVGGTGLTGKYIVKYLESKGHYVIVASPSRGVNAQTGEGVEQALSGAEILIDVSNLMKWNSDAILDFYRKSTANLIEAGKHIKHYVVLSIVGIDKMAHENIYMQAKFDQENLVTDSGIPYTIVRATQFYEFTGGIATVSNFKVSTSLYQPIAAEDVAINVSDVALSPPQNGIVELAGPESLPMDQVAKDYFKAKPEENAQEVVSTPGAKYINSITLNDNTLRPAFPNPLFGKITLEQWLERNTWEHQMPCWGLVLNFKAVNDNVSEMAMSLKLLKLVYLWMYKKLLL